LVFLIVALVIFSLVFKDKGAFEVGDLIKLHPLFYQVYYQNYEDIHCIVLEKFSKDTHGGSAWYYKVMNVKTNEVLELPENDIWPLKLVDN
jgi:hypothetical protein